jgi:hypothetical protein
MMKSFIISVLALIIAVSPVAASKPIDIEPSIQIDYANSNLVFGGTVTFLTTSDPGKWEQPAVWLKCNADVPTYENGPYGEYALLQSVDHTFILGSPEGAPGSWWEQGSGDCTAELWMRYGLNRSGNFLYQIGEPVFFHVEG